MWKFVCAALLLFGLTGCVEITETVTINDSGAGTYQTDMDASKLMALIKTFAQQSGDTSTFGQHVDSTFSFKSIADTSMSIDPALKPILSKATAHIVMNADNNMLKFTLLAPFDNLGQLQTLQNQLSKSGGGLQAMGDLLGKKKDNADSKGIGGVGSMFTTTYTDHMIQRSLNKARYDSLMQDPSMQQVQQMSALMGDAKFVTIIHLPRPAAKVSSKASVLSEDRKTVTFERTMSEMFATPDDFNFTIEY